jgi:hypothetical protein
VSGSEEAVRILDTGVPGFEASATSSGMAETDPFAAVGASSNGMTVRVLDTLGLEANPSWTLRVMVRVAETEMGELFL